MNSGKVKKIGNKMHNWATDLFPICCSLSGPGVRKTLQYIQNLIPELNICSVPSGTQAFDWIVPDEWSIRDAFIDDSAGYSGLKWTPQVKDSFSHELRCTLVCFSLYYSRCLPGNFSSPINLCRSFSCKILMWSLKIVKLKILL